MASSAPPRPLATPGLLGNAYMYLILPQKAFGPFKGYTSNLKGFRLFAVDLLIEKCFFLVGR